MNVPQRVDSGGSGGGGGSRTIPRGPRTLPRGPRNLPRGPRNRGSRDALSVTSFPVTLSPPRFLRDVIPRGPPPRDVLPSIWRDGSANYRFVYP